MGKKDHNFISLNKTADLAISIILFSIAGFSAFLLFTGQASAQNIRQFVSPHAACQFYYGQQGFTIVRDLEHDCLARNGNSQTGFVYTHYFDSGENFCIEVTSTQGRVFGPQCVSIASTGRIQQQQQQNNNSKTPKIIAPPAFQIRELQYDTLPSGKPVKSDDNERIEITMPDGSLIQLDANATFTPVSDHEVQSVFGRYRYLWTPFHDGMCIVGQNLVRQPCRKVKTRDAVLGDKGTEFLVETTKSGTTVTVLAGTVIATDLGGKKTIEISAGNSAFIKHGGLPEEPKAFDSSKLDRWWEKKTAQQISDASTKNLIKIIEIVFGIVIFILLFVLFVKIIVFIIRKIIGRKKPLPQAATQEKKEENKPS